MIEKFFVNRSGNELEKLSNQERQEILKNVPFRLENFYEEILFFIYKESAFWCERMKRVT